MMAMPQGAIFGGLFFFFFFEIPLLPAAFVDSLPWLGVSEAL